MPRTTSGSGPATGSRATRSLRERILQTLWFEGIGLVIISPIFALLAGERAGPSAAVLALLSIAVMTWSALYNSVFDSVELRVTNRPASARPHGLRLVHAFGNEATALFVTWPLIVALTGLNGFEALAAELGLTLAYAVYGYVFHLVFDLLRPVGSPVVREFRTAEGVQGEAT